MPTTLRHIAMLRRIPRALDTLDYTVDIRTVQRDLQTSVWWSDPVINWLMHLPPELEKKLGDDILQIEEEHKMPYVSSIERIGIEKGRAEGLPQGQARMLQKQLAKRFGMLPSWAEQRILSAQPDQLEDWSLRVLDGKSVEDVLVVREEPAKYADD